jgi:hypothetical protein
MRRFLKLIGPYILAIVCAVGIFAAGAYLGFYFMGSVFTPRFGQDELSRLVNDHSLLLSLDAGQVDQARSLLILREDAHLMALDGVSPYLSDELANSTCRIMRRIAKQRADNAGKYTETALAESPEVRKMVSESLQSPAGCLRTGREK